jgi:hypothetical protein
MLVRIYRINHHPVIEKGTSMISGERELLLETARAIAELLEGKAAHSGTTNNHAALLRLLSEKIRPK